MYWKTLLSSAVVLGSITSLFSQYTPPDPMGFEGIVAEVYYVSDGSDTSDTEGSFGLNVGEVTYRLFVDLKPGYKLLTIGGFANHPFTISTTTSLFNNNDRGEAWGRLINDAFLDVNTTAIDSWLTIGAASDAHWGILKTEDPDGSIVGGANNDGGSNAVPGGLLVNDVPIMGIPLTTSDGLWAPSAPPPSNALGPAPNMFDPGGASSYSEENFAWAVLGGLQGPDSLTTNRILIGQFTTDGELEVCLNFWVKIPDSLVCADPNCHQFLEYYSTIVPSDTAGGGITADNKFTHPTLCFNSSTVLVDCEGVPGGPAQPGTPCDDGNVDTQIDVYAANCDCMGEDCLGVLGGTDLPGAPCDDGNSGTVNDTWLPGCLCEGIVGINEIDPGASISIHPNPTRDRLWLEIDIVRSEKAAYELRDALGNRVLAHDLGLLSGDRTVIIDMVPLSRGVYFLQVNLNGRVHTERITRF